MPLVPAICTQCGSQIEVDNTHEAGICKFCETAFITEKVINTYNVNSYGIVNITNAVISNGPSAINYVKRAMQFKKEKNFTKAIEYYNKALDIDADCNEALQGITDINEEVVLANVAELVKKQEIRKAIILLQEEKRKGLATHRIVDALEKIETNLVNTIFYSGEAQYRFKKTQLTATKGKLTMGGKKLLFESTNESFDIDIEDICSFSTIENMYYGGETFGRTVPNCIVVEYKGKKASTIERKQIRVHKAQQVAVTLNDIPQKIRT